LVAVVVVAVDVPVADVSADGAGSGWSWALSAGAGFAGDAAGGVAFLVAFALAPGVPGHASHTLSFDCALAWPAASASAAALIHAIGLRIVLGV
jgi:hypothetical protein